MLFIHIWFEMVPFELCTPDWGDSKVLLQTCLADAVFFSLIWFNAATSVKFKQLMYWKMFAELLTDNKLKQNVWTIQFAPSEQFIMPASILSFTHGTKLIYLFMYVLTLLDRAITVGWCYTIFFIAFVSKKAICRIVQAATEDNANVLIKTKCRCKWTLEMKKKCMAILWQTTGVQNLKHGFTPKLTLKPAVSVLNEGRP